MMKVAARLGDGTAGLVDKPDPTPKEDYVLVKVRSVPMCTEYKAFKDFCSLTKIDYRPIAKTTTHFAIEII